TTILSYRAADDGIARVAGALRALGVGRGSVVGLFGVPTAEAVLTIFALLRLGAIALPMNERLQAETLLEQAAIAKVASVVTGPSAAGVFDAARAYSVEALLATASDPYEAAELELDAEATIVFTSGSTGVGKGVVHTIENHWSSAAASLERNGLTPSSVWLLSLQLFHVGGLEIPFRTALAGAAFATCAGSDFESIKSGVVAAAVTHVSLVPTQLADLRDNAPQALSQLQFVMLGGAPAAIDFLQSLVAEGVPLRTSYGMTETTSHITLLCDENLPDGIATSGTPLSHVSIAIVDETKNAVPQGTVGQIAVRGGSIFKRYVDQAPEQSRSPDDWFYTGDLGSFDAHGRLTVHGRLDDMIISGGENIHLSEITAVVERVPGVKRAVTLAIDDRRWGKRPVAIIEGTDSAVDLEAAVLAFCRQQLPSYKVPDRLLVVSSMPLLPNGKFDRPLLQQWIESGSS
ncbi:MAG: o-succinylbenzoate--CoA ligase, partial [Bdellovibrionales bacterium]|nr:o-succinylbenzoate--CoA ligase [Bdellovibrionales bacterium]